MHIEKKCPVDGLLLLTKLLLQRMLEHEKGLSTGRFGINMKAPDSLYEQQDRSSKVYDI